MNNKKIWIKIYLGEETHRKFKTLCAYDTVTIQSKVIELIESELMKTNKFNDNVKQIESDIKH